MSHSVRVRVVVIAKAIRPRCAALHDLGLSKLYYYYIGRYLPSIVQYIAYYYYFLVTSGKVCVCR